MKVKLINGSYWDRSHEGEVFSVTPFGYNQYMVLESDHTELYKTERGRNPDIISLLLFKNDCEIVF